VKVQIIDFSEPELVHRYEQLFEECPGAFIQQSTYWSEVIKPIGPDTPIFIICEENGKDIGGMPLYLFTHELGNILSSVPQAGPLGGVFYREGLADETIDELYRICLNEAVEIARQYHCIALTIITNPFIADLALYEQYLQPDLIFENFTQFIDITKIFDGDQITLRDYYRSSNIRRNIRRGEEYGYSVKICESDAEFNTWYAIHNTRHKEIGLNPIDKRLLEKIYYSMVPAKKAELILLEHEGRIASGCMYIFHRNIMDVFMISMDSQYANKGVNYILTDYSLRYANQHGIKLYNWQSSQSKESGVYEFKKQWGSVDSHYYFVTKLFCQPERIEKIGMDNLRTQYKGHYVVPFKVFSEGFSQRYYRKG
jgi:hypothetical protein